MNRKLFTFLLFPRDRGGITVMQLWSKPDLKKFSSKISDPVIGPVINVLLPFDQEAMK